MTFPVPLLAQPVTGFPVSQAYLQAQVYNPLDFLLNKPDATVYLPADWSLPNNAYTPVPWTAAQTDNWNGHSNTTNPSRYTAPVSGTYAVDGAITFDGNATGIRAVKIYKNGSAVTGTNLWEPTSGTNFVTISIPAFSVPCLVGDYLEIAAFQNTGHPFNIKAVGAYMHVEFKHQ